MVPNIFKSVSQEKYEQIAGTNWPVYDIFAYSDYIDPIVFEELKQFFKLEQDSDDILQSESKYDNLLEKNYFQVCHSKKVLEIGPSTGRHTKLICNNRPSEFHVIEADKKCIPYLKKIKVDKLINDDIFHVLTKEEKFDVVVCFGVLYHLPNSLYLLELIVNYNSPNFILLDCVNDDQEIKTLPEIANKSGQRQTRKNWKSCGLNLVLPFKDINLALTNLGYTCAQKHKLEIKNLFEKSNSWIAMFEKNR